MDFGFEMGDADFIIPEDTRNDDKVTLCDALMALMIATTATASELELMLPLACSLKSYELGPGGTRRPGAFGVFTAAVNFFP